jgi:hypothetical protein
MKLELLLLPLVPLSALGIVEIASRISSPAPVVCEANLVEESEPPLESDGDWCGTRLLR